MYQFFFIVLFVAGGFLIEYLRERKMKLSKYKLNNSITFSFVKVEIPREEVKIVSNKFYSEVEKDNSISVKALDSLYSPERNIYHQIGYASALVCKDCNINGKTFTFASKTIALSEMVILEKLYKVNKISVYYNSKNLKEHYFDLSFLI